MKRVALVVMMLMLLVPGVAAADGSTDAALALGAFAVFNQIISGAGVFGHPGTVVVERPVVIERRVVVERPVVIERPVVVERRMFVAPPPVVVYETPAPASYGSYVHYAYPGHAWCPPGLAKKGRCHRHWGRHHHR